MAMSNSWAQSLIKTADDIVGDGITWAQVLATGNTWAGFILVIVGIIISLVLGLIFKSFKRT